MLYIWDLCNIVNQPYLIKKKNVGLDMDKWFQLYLDSVFGRDHWAGKNPSVTSFIYSSQPFPPIYQEQLHVISHPTNQTLVKTR